jgi:hypothetical protein
LFPEGVTSGEDILLGRNLMRSGKVLIFDPDPQVYHDFDTSEARLRYKEERSGRGHFDRYHKDANVLKRAGMVLLSPFYIVGRMLTGLRRIVLYDDKKTDILTLMPYLFSSGVSWTKGYLKGVLNVNR